MFTAAVHCMCRRCIATLVGMALQSLALVVQAQLACAQAGPAGREGERPAYQLLRFNEDWSVLKGQDLSMTDDSWDRLKFIPLNRDETVYLTLGGQIRERAEYFRNYLFGASVPEATDAYLLSRYRLSADLHVTNYFRLFGEVKGAFSTDRDLKGGNSSSFESKFTLFNAFADIAIPFGEEVDVTLRGGRFEMVYGSGRLIATSDFSQVPRTFDGGLGIVRLGAWTITPFWTSPVAPAVDVTNFPYTVPIPHRTLFGIFGTNAREDYPSLPLLAGPLPSPFNLDIYWFGVNNAVATFNGTSGREERQTLGGRILGSVGHIGLDFEVEGAGQFGTVGSESIAAGMFTTVLRYTPQIPRLAPRVYLEFDYASGDGKPGGSVGTYDQLYPTSHSFLGYIDYIGRQNILSASGGFAMTPIRGLTVSLQQYFFWRASDRDALYDKSGSVLRPGTGTTARYVGAELDLLVNYNFTRHQLGYAGYSHFFPGEFIQKTGPAKPTDFFYVALQYTF
jgi:Alginate export